MPGVLPETNDYPQPAAVDPNLPAAAARIREHQTTIRHAAYEFRPFATDAQKAAARIEFATPAEVQRDVTARLREYTAEKRDYVRRAIAEGKALQERSADLIPKAAAKARKRQEPISAGAQTLRADLASRLQAAEPDGLGGHPQLQLALRLHDQFTRERDQAGLYALRIEARPYLKLGTEHGDDAHRARDLMRTFAHEDEAARGDVPQLERDHEAITRALADLEGEAGLLAERLNAVFPEDPTVWNGVLYPEPDVRAAWDAVPSMWKDDSERYG